MADAALTDKAGRPRRTAQLVYTFGFRPFFLLAGLFASLGLLAWVGQWFGHVTIPAAVSPLIWHGHEMIFGYALAVIAGFLLTASANWLATKPFAGIGLFLLTLLWLAGRVAYWSAAELPVWLVASLDLGFIAALFAVLAPPLIRGRAKRQLPLLGLLGLLFLANLLTYLEPLGFPVDPRIGLILGVDLVAMLIGIMGGRIIPSFTGNALRARGIQAAPRLRPWLERLAAPSLALFVASDVWLEGTAVAGAIALLAAGLHALRLSGWQTRHTLNQPILWILHVGYGWLVLALALRGLADLSPVISTTAALHALTAGTIGVMTLGVMSRVALGHTGRALIVSRWTVAAYGLVNLAALIRVFVPLLLPDLHSTAIAASGLLWSGAFLLFSLVYWPILTGPRVTGT